MSNKYSVTVGGTSFLNLLFLVFLVLKLTNVITWSWWWVTAPLWMPIAVVIGCLVVAFVVAIIIAGTTNRDQKWWTTTMLKTSWLPESSFCAAKLSRLDFPMFRRYWNIFWWQFIRDTEDIASFLPYNYCKYPSSWRVSSINFGQCSWRSLGNWRFLPSVFCPYLHTTQTPSTLLARTLKE